MRGIFGILALGVWLSLTLTSCAGADVGRIDSDLEALKTRVQSVEARVKKLESGKPAAKASKSKSKSKTKGKTKEGTAGAAKAGKSKTGGDAAKAKSAKAKAPAPATPTAP